MSFTGPLVSSVSKPSLALTETSIRLHMKDSSMKDAPTQSSILYLLGYIPLPKHPLIDKQDGDLVLSIWTGHANIVL